MLPGEPGRWPYARRHRTEGQRYSPPRGCGNRPGMPSASHLRSLHVEAVDRIDDELRNAPKEGRSCASQGDVASVRGSIERHGQYAVHAVGALSHHPHEESPMAQYQAYPPSPPPGDPGRTLGIVGLILAFFCSLIGLIISIIAYRQSQQAGYKNNIALAG